MSVAGWARADLSVGVSNHSWKARMRIREPTPLQSSAVLPGATVRQTPLGSLPESQLRFSLSCCEMGSHADK